MQLKIEDVPSVIPCIMSRQSSFLSVLPAHLARLAARLALFFRRARRGIFFRFLTRHVPRFCDLQAVDCPSLFVATYRMICALLMRQNSAKCEQYQYLEHYGRKFGNQAGDNFLLPFLLMRFLQALFHRSGPCRCIAFCDGGPKGLSGPSVLSGALPMAR